MVFDSEGVPMPYVPRALIGARRLLVLSWVVHLPPLTELDGNAL